VKTRFTWPYERGRFRCLPQLLSALIFA